MKCNSCQSIIPNSSQFCKVCGEKISVDYSSIDKRNTDSQPNELLSRQYDDDGIKPTESNLTKKKPVRSKNIILLTIISGLLVIALATFFGVRHFQQKARNDNFNAELEKLFFGESSNTREINGSVEGNYGSRIFLTYASNGFAEFIDRAKNDSERKLHEQLVEETNELFCLSLFAERSELLDSYSKKKEYAKDKAFQAAQHINPRCIFLIGKDRFEYYKDPFDGDVLMKNGIPVEKVNVKDIFSYGNPSPALQELMDKHNATLNAKEVQFDMANKVNELFGLEGTAELCDYYNYGYDDSIKSRYFCMEVTPDGGTYSDRWYIYGNRSSASKLYDDLLKGSVNIKLIAMIEGSYYEINQQNMATLYNATWYGGRSR